MRQIGTGFSPRVPELRKFHVGPLRRLMTSRSALRNAAAIVAACACVNAYADDYSLTGNASVDIVEQTDSNGNFAGWGASAGASLAFDRNIPIPVSISINPAVVGEPDLKWSNLYVWQHQTLGVVNAVNLIQNLVILTKDVTNPPKAFDDAQKLVDSLQNQGPTETTFWNPAFYTVSVPGANNFSATFGANVSVTYDVNIPSQASITVDQTAILHSLSVAQGGQVSGAGSSYTFDVRTNLNNAGYLGIGSGTVEGNLVNTAAGSGNLLDIGGTLNVKGQLQNTGTLRLGNGGNLSLSKVFANSGQIVVNGGTLSIPQGLISTGDILVQSGYACNISNSGTFELVGGSVDAVTNSGTFTWTGGKLYNLTNASGTLLIPGSANVSLEGTLDNKGTITHQAGGISTMGGPIINEMGAVYDLRGDGQHVGSDGLGPVYNAGLFRKSVGSGTSYVWIPFMNTGTVEVDVGAIEFTGGGSSSNGNVQLSGGSSALLRAGNFDVQGTTTLTGPGTLTVDRTGCIRTAANQTATISSSETTFMVNGGSVYGDAGGTLTFDMHGSSALVFGYGAIGCGSGQTINTGNFNWAGGTLYNLTNASDHFLISAGGVLEGTLDNKGTITHQSGGITVQAGQGILNEFGSVYDFHGDGQHIDGSAPISNAGVFRKSAGAGTSYISAPFTNAGSIEVDSGTLSFASGFTQTQGSMHLSGGGISFASTAIFSGGEVGGSGTITGNILNSGASVRPGISILGAYAQGPNGTLQIEIAGTGQTPALSVNGAASLDGTISIRFLNGFVPNVGDTFEVLDYRSVSGRFSTVIAPNSGVVLTPEYNANSLSLVVQSVPEPSTVSAFAVVSLGLLARRRVRSNSSIIRWRR